MTWDGEWLALDQLRDMAAEQAERTDAGEMRDALLRLAGLVCRICLTPTVLSVLERYDGRCEDCALEEGS